MESAYQTSSEARWDVFEVARPFMCVITENKNGYEAASLVITLIILIFF